MNYRASELSGRIEVARDVWGTAAQAHFESDDIPSMDDEVIDVEDFLAGLLPHAGRFVSWLGDPSAPLRAWTARALGALGQLARDPYTVPDEQAPALAALLDAARPGLRGLVLDRSAGVRAFAVQALGCIGGPRQGERDDDDEGATPVDRADPADAAALDSALGDRSGAVRKEAVIALASCSGLAAAPRLAGLGDDPSPRVRSQVTDTLVEMKSPRAVPLLLARIRAAGPRGDWLDLMSLRSFSADAAEARAALVPLIGPEARKDTRQQAAQTLVAYVDRSCLPALLALLPAHDHESVYAAIALGRLGAEVPSAPLIAGLSSEAGVAERLTTTCAWALAATGRADGLDRLIELFDAAVVRQRDAVDGAVPVAIHPGHLLPAMAMFEDRRMHAVALRTLAKKPAWGERHACLALGVCGDPAGVPHLRAALRATPTPASVQGWTESYRLHAAIGLALLDPEAVDVEWDATGGWPGRIATYEIETLVLAFAIRLLGRRLLGRRLGRGARALVAASRAFAERLLRETPHWGGGIWSGYTHYMPALAEEARTSLAQVADE